MEAEKKVWHITGWRAPVKRAEAGGSYFYPTMNCWGWATWADRWQYFKKDAVYYKSLFTDEMKYHFDVEGTQGMWSQVEDNISGKINTWAIFWYATIFLKNGLCLAPSKSLVKNVGLDNSGVHCGENPKLNIRGSIDFKIENYPEKIEITQDEYKKNVDFFIDLSHEPVLKRFKNSIKLKLRKTKIFSTLYFALKKLLLSQ